MLRIWNMIDEAIDSETEPNQFPHTGTNNAMKKCSDKLKKKKK